MKPCLTQKIIENEEGAALILALILMSVLTILAVTSMNTTTTEYQIVGNERIFQDNFYRAESAARQGVQALEVATPTQLDDRTFTTLTWLSQQDSNIDMSDTSVWTSSNSAAASVSDADYAVEETGIASGSSLDMTATSNLYSYISRGYGYTGNGGDTLIEIGYRMRH